MKSAAIIDYGVGNLDSVARAVEECGAQAFVTSSKRDIEEASHIILPGVGAYKDGMDKLSGLGLVEILSEQVIDRHIPFLGICLGMQLLATEGEEGGGTEGLGWIEGKVIRLVSSKPTERIPHIGWNNVSYKDPGVLFEGIPSGKDFYFVHSYHYVCSEEYIIAKTPYCGNFVSAVNRDNIFGIQFHPEKSQKLGMKLLANFLEYVC